ncbi:hypothetical protein, partial [Stomatobaculum longum]|uniref:hypothetical protein n=1 Tax=Stomatobaculum longum TaxID=796942 RepID=UPI0028EF099A
LQAKQVRRKALCESTAPFCVRSQTSRNFVKQTQIASAKCIYITEGRRWEMQWSIEKLSETSANRALRKTRFHRKIIKKDSKVRKWV